ncbi:MAG: metal-dependent transcriptional regulator, partial [Bryobacterales bacterium]|nr:metal-dependent transcriptional regulator [Bryobacterales bacterium]
VHEEAEQLEHAVSEDFERRLIERLGPGGVCPHGNVIGLDTPEERRKRGWMPLGDLSKASAARVVSVFERDRQLLEYFDGLGIRPGATLQMLSQNYDDTITLSIDGRAVPLGRSAANKVWVEPAL